LFTVRDDRGLLAAVLALVYAREVLAWWSGTHPEGRHRHAFPLLLWSLAEWCAERGVERLNLGASGGFDSLIAFKRSFGARSLRYPVRWLDACHAGPLGRAVARAQSWWRCDRARGASAGRSPHSPPPPCATPCRSPRGAPICCARSTRSSAPARGSCSSVPIWSSPTPKTWPGPRATWVLRRRGCTASRGAWI